MLKHLCIFCLFWISCNSDSIFSTTVNIENSILQDSQRIDFNWKINDTLGKYNLILSIKHTGELPSQNLYIKCISSSPNNQISEQVVSLELLNSAGKPYGKCSFGDCDLKIILASNIFFPSVGNYSLTILPYSRITPFPGIKQIGLSIEPIHSK